MSALINNPILSIDSEQLFSGPQLLIRLPVCEVYLSFRVKHTNIGNKLLLKVNETHLYFQFLSTKVITM